MQCPWSAGAVQIRAPVNFDSGTLLAASVNSDVIYVWDKPVQTWDGRADRHGGSRRPDSLYGTIPKGTHKHDRARREEVASIVQSGND